MAAGEPRPALGLRDVTLRDGLQTEAPVATADKLAIFEADSGINLTIEPPACATSS